MKEEKTKVIAFKNLPSRIPLDRTILGFVVCDFYKPSFEIQIIVWFFVAISWISFFRNCDNKHVNIFDSWEKFKTLSDKFDEWKNKK